MLISVYASLQILIRSFIVHQSDIDYTQQVLDAKITSMLCHDVALMLISCLNAVYLLGKDTAKDNLDPEMLCSVTTHMVLQFL